MPGFAFVSLLLCATVFAHPLVQARSSTLASDVESTASVADVRRSLVGDVRPVAYSEDTLAIPCPSCFPDTLETGADDSLVFNISIGYTEDLADVQLWLDDTYLDVRWIDTQADSRQILTLSDSSGIAHTVEVAWSGHYQDSEFDSDPKQILKLWLAGQSSTSRKLDHPDLIIIHGRNLPSAFIPQSLGGWFPASMLPLVEPSEIDENTSDAGQPLDDHYGPVDFDLARELEALRLLEDQAVELHEQIAARKQMIHANSGRYQDKHRLKQLKKQCDRVVYAANDLLQSIYRKVGLRVDSSVSQGDGRVFTTLRSQARRYGKSQTALMASANSHDLESILEEQVDADDGITLMPEQAHKTLVQVLAILAAALGLTALAGFIHRKCMSLRRRVERAADREERYNARAYRRAARRAEMRRRWDNLKRALSCFGRKDSPSLRSDYEEKRALILQDAYLEQGADLAEKGEILEAEIRELRHAQEIVASLLRVDEHRFVLARPPRDPPPPLVALPLTPAPRSRASTATLPSYSSEPLPDYSSRRRSDAASTASSCIDRYRRGSSSGEATHFTALSTPPLTEGSSRCTPDSSVRDVSPRLSFDTLYTRLSRSEV